MQSANRSVSSTFPRLLCVFLALLLGVGIAQPSVAASGANSTVGPGTRHLDIPAELLPPDMGQTDLKVFVPETGHTIQGTMLDYWRANGAASVYGNPISEPYLAPNGYYSQAFERGVFQFLPEVIWTDDPTIRLQPVGADTFASNRDAMRADGRRVAGDRRATRTIPASENPERQNTVYSEGGRLSTETGFSISGSFGTWYDSHEGWFYLGSPISEPFRHRGVMVQMYQNGMLMDRGGEVLPAPLPRENAIQLGIDTAPVAQGDLPAYSESLFVSAPNPYGVDTTTMPGRRSIVVDVATQTFTAYQGDQIILQTPTSTGLEPNETEIGAFHVRMKFPEQDMQGFTDSTGEVVSVGDSEGNGSGEGYSVTDVPHVLYINYDAEALHGAYWHNNFGQRMSHGCINLPLDVAEFIYQWAPIGTAVTVVE